MTTIEQLLNSPKAKWLCLSFCIVFGITVFAGYVTADAYINEIIPAFLDEWDGYISDGKNVIITGTYIDSGMFVPANYTQYESQYEYVRILSNDNTIQKITIFPLKSNNLYKICPHVTHDEVRYAVVISVVPANEFTQQHNYKLVLKRELC